MSEGQLAAIADDGEENKTQVFLLGHLVVASGVILSPRAPKVDLLRGVCVRN